MLALGYLAISGLMIGTAALLDAFPDHVPVDIGFHVLPKLTGQMLAFPIEDYLIYWRNGKLPKSAKSLDGISRVMTPCPIRGMVFDMDGVIMTATPPIGVHGSSSCRVLAGERRMWS